MDGTPNDIRKTPFVAAPQVAEASRKAGEVKWLPAPGQTLSWMKLAPAAFAVGVDTPSEARATGLRNKTGSPLPVTAGPLPRGGFPGEAGL